MGNKIFYDGWYLRKDNSRGRSRKSVERSSSFFLEI